jgi:hypothetical protein
MKSVKATLNTVVQSIVDKANKQHNKPVIFLDLFICVIHFGLHRVPERIHVDYFPIAQTSSAANVMLLLMSY